MTTWTLVVYLFIGPSKVPTLYSIPGFITADACADAGEDATVFLKEKSSEALARCYSTGSVFSDGKKS